MNRTVGKWALVVALVAGCTPTDETPDGTVALDSGPAGDASDGTPTDGAPSDGTPSDGTPSDGTPSDGTPTDGAPSDGTLTDGASADGSPPDSTPTDAGTPDDGTPDAADPCLHQDGGCPEPGALDPTFGGTGFIVPALAAEDEFNAVAVLPDGRIVVAGSARRDTHDLLLARFDAEGALEGEPWIHDVAGGTDRAYGLALDPETGAIFVAGHVGDEVGVVAALVRIDARGFPDVDFGTDGLRTERGLREGTYRDISRLADGRVLAGGDSRDAEGRFTRVLARYHPDGAPDADFGPNGRVTLPAPGGHPSARFTVNGDIAAVAGYVEQGADDRATLARVSDDGTILDDRVDASGVGDAGAANVADRLFAIVSHGGGLYAAGERVTPGARDMLVLRFDADGVRDPGFGDDGRVTLDFAGDTDTAYALTIDPEGHLLIAGRARLDGVDHAALARLQADGTPDETFGPQGRRTWTIEGGRDAAITTLTPTADGRLIVAGRTATDTGHRAFLGRIFR